MSNNLEIPATPKLVQKIKAYAQLVGGQPKDLENLFVQAIEQQLDTEIITRSKAKIDAIIEAERAILESAGISSEFLNASGQSISAMDALHNVGQFPEKELIIPLQEISEPEEEKVEEAEEEFEDDEDEIGMGSLGGSEEDFDNMDMEMPEEAKEEFIMPDEDEEEDMENILDKDGNETQYEDDFMNDIQSEIDDMDDFDGGGIMAAASASYNSDEDMDGGSTGSSSGSGDRPVESDTPDILPADFGMSEVSGNDNNAASFFTNAVEGRQGDTSGRNRIRRKRVKGSY